MERLEKEHQERLAGVKELGNDWGVQAALEGGAAVLGAMGSMNKKALKAQGVFAAAAALMSTYKGAATALELPFPQNMAAAASVIAKGIGFVSAIKSAASSGASGAAPSASGGAASATQAAAPAPLQVNLNTFGAGDLVSMMDFGAVLDRLNDAAGDRGYNILRPA